MIAWSTNETVIYRSFDQPYISFFIWPYVGLSGVAPSNFFGSSGPPSVLNCYKSEYLFPGMMPGHTVAM